MNMEHQCDQCKHSFGSKAFLTEHKKATGHLKCPHCTAVLASVQGVSDHCMVVHPFKCPQCTETRRTKSTLKDHQESANHCYCGDCDQAFPTVSALAEHLQKSLHSTGFQCCDCSKSFTSSSALDQHLKDKQHQLLNCPECNIRFSHREALKTHLKKHDHITKNRDRSCQACLKVFKDPAALKQHMLSIIHIKPLCSIQCSGASCKKKFSAYSQWLQHLEGGACPSGVTRKQLNQFVIAHDTDGLITKAEDRTLKQLLHQVNQRLLENTEAAYRFSRSNEEAVTPTSSYSSTASTVLTPEVMTPGSTNEISAEWSSLVVSQTVDNRCPFCRPTRRPFCSKEALHQHLQSPAHTEPFFSCPISLSKIGHGISKIGKSFSTISGLTQHLESGACAGGTSAFWKALERLDTKLRSAGLKALIS